ncbi:hypothetical protein ACH5RR_025784 [Cinchona calisaya]|uniref:Uncharacterized protein n=1 Tax=Cinchona calisaya TaxID=153742 RepID=A0ABD2Z3V2_9GENT
MVENIEDDEEAFRYCQIRVQVWNLPIHWFLKEFGWKIGKSFHKVQEVKVAKIGSHADKNCDKVLDNYNQNEPRYGAWLRAEASKSPIYSREGEGDRVFPQLGARESLRQGREGGSTEEGRQRFPIEGLGSGFERGVLRVR